jgi:hypothetical protein
LVEVYFLSYVRGMLCPAYWSAIITSKLKC